MRLGLVEAGALSALPWNMHALGSPSGDPLCTTVERLAREHGYEWVPLPSLDEEGAVDVLFKTVRALLVVTDGQSYAMAELARRGRVALGSAMVHERVVEWRQETLW